MNFIVQYKSTSFVRLRLYITKYDVYHNIWYGEVNINKSQKFTLTQARKIINKSPIYGIENLKILYVKSI